QFRRGLERSAHLVAAIRGPDGIGTPGRTAVIRPQRLTSDTRRLVHKVGPSRERRRRVGGIKMDPERRSWIEPASQRIGRCGHKEIVDALVLRDVGIALLQYKIAPSE